MLRRNIMPQITENMILARARDMEENRANEPEVDNSPRAEMLRMYQKWCRENEKGLDK